MATGGIDRWSSGSGYEAYVGRWSRLVAPEFLDWLAIPPLRRGSTSVAGRVGEALAEARRVVSHGGLVAGYVWDHAEGMQLLRRFWDAAAALDPAARALDKGARFGSAAPEPLAAAFTAAGLEAAAVRPIEVPTVFADFEDLWKPFLGGTGPAPGYAASLPEPGRSRDGGRRSGESGVGRHPAAGAAPERSPAA